MSRRTTHTNLPPIVPIATCLALVAACSSGGGAPGGDPGNGDVDLNEGSYSIEDFDYVDERPPGAHPLGSDGFQVLARDEVFVTHATYDGEGRDFAMHDELDATHATVPGVAGLFPGPDLLHAAAGGQLDDDPESELVAATIDPSESSLTLHLVERDPLGVYGRTVLNTVTITSWSLEDARVTLADFDGDFRDEIVVVARSGQYHAHATSAQVWVFDDPLDGGGQLMTFGHSGDHIGMWALPVDIDEDGVSELGIGLSGDTTDLGRFAVRLYDHVPTIPGLSLLHGWVYLSADSAVKSSRAVVGDFDGNGREDLAWVGYTPGASTVMDVKLFEFAAPHAWNEYASWSILDVSPAPSFQAGEWDATSYRVSPKQHGVAVAFRGGSNYPYSALRFDRGLEQWTSTGTTIDRYETRQGIALAASDVDADGEEEVTVGLVHYGTSSGRMDLGVLEHGALPQLTWKHSSVLVSGTGASSTAPTPVLAVSDYDADGFAIQHTGMRSTRLADPIPLVVLGAPPTKDGISQNYDDSESAYSSASTQGSTIGVSTYTSLTKGAGVNFDLFGLIGVEGRASIEKGVERTQQTTRQETVVEGYRGAYSDDVIIFQGTLYETYEYVITAAQDPTAIGAFITLDIPIDANTYKWTVDYYNAQVAADDRIGTDLLTHTPGEIETYPTRTQLGDLMSGEVHWDLQGSRPVGQGSASDFQSVSFATENATAVQRTIERSFGGGLSFGVSGSIDQTTSEGATHGVVYGTETTFEATVGDIASASEYETWRYTWGFSIHSVGRTSTPTNEPTGYTQRKHSFQYLRYWVETTGSGY